MKRSVIIFGAGVSGLTLGWKLAKQNYQVRILEASSQVGGLAGTIRQKGYCLDFGPHSFFTDDEEISKIFHHLFPSPLPPLSRRVRFRYQGKYLDYPLTAQSVLFQMGLHQGLKALGSFLITRFAPSKEPPLHEQSVKDWAVRHFGRHLYETFFKPYTEQFWKIPAEDLSAQSIPTSTRTGFFKALHLMLQKNSPGKNPSLMERETLPTFYPSTGYGELPERILAEFLRAGGKLVLDSKVTGLEHLPSNEFRIETVENQTITNYLADIVVSTIPLPVLIQTLEPAVSPEVRDAANRLKYRPLIVLGLMTSKQKVLRDWMYVYFLDRSYNRIFETSQFSSSACPPGKNLLALEIPCSFQDPLYCATAEDLLEKVLPDLHRDGLLERGDIEGMMLVKSKYAYPIYHLEYRKHLALVHQYLSSIPNLHILGRTGEFRYMDADRCMRFALELFGKIDQHQPDKLPSY
ncbi:MAG: hypothetical protein EXS63_00600 [Candidatus Omnitrophica bacterium]|nr:hypothetical protein [Candidatus Omnitrophota bacterium]